MGPSPGAWFVGLFFGLQLIWFLLGAGGLEGKTWPRIYKIVGGTWLTLDALIFLALMIYVVIFEHQWGVLVLLIFIIPLSLGAYLLLRSGIDRNW